MSSYVVGAFKNTFLARRRHQNKIENQENQENRENHILSASRAKSKVKDSGKIKINTNYRTISVCFSWSSAVFRFALCVNKKLLAWQLFNTFGHEFLYLKGFSYQFRNTEKEIIRYLLWTHIIFTIIVPPSNNNNNIRKYMIMNLENLFVFAKFLSFSFRHLY